MSLNKCNVKTGMKGSSSGRGRWELTAVLKNASKRRRREQGKIEIKEQS